MAADTPVFFLDAFAMRQFTDPTYQGTRLKCSPEEFARQVNERCGLQDLKDGYAPFCKHVFVENFVGASCPVVELNAETEQLVTSAYKARTEKELPVLTRWIPADRIQAPQAKYLDVILYSREQIIDEHNAMKDENVDIPDSPWGIISVKAQMEPFETPMQPITMMRNALGKDEGGSGVTLDRAKYQESVEYWSRHVPIA
ncbi:uncharacterized protein MONBRDRAFT_27941 [Monosiga brevicollis MX1]|uniref:Flagellar associated protein n=1 Tax=Monosiga brevicollis TaxID=81824 RepID=A9V6H0_MONBE|nr:uncharacterized protein MONBRDRAFT_27941 [Monosiga brevicollis MX1]EDQ86806.1 predicted protein [Monosiga brevicollis MX1]|eukprot:XP_001748351.1 hypothetical protein [Monosiga brevicollis MX1]